MGLHPSMGTLVLRGSGLNLDPHPIGDGEKGWSWEALKAVFCVPRTLRHQAAGAGCTRVQPIRRGSKDNLALCSNPKGTPSKAGEKDLESIP